MSNTFNAKESFSKFERPSFFSRVDSTHKSDWFVGLDSEGHKTLKLKHNSKVSSFKSTKTIEVTQFKVENYYNLHFSLLNEELSMLFYRFVEDIVESSRDFENISTYSFAKNRYNSWQKMFALNNFEILSESEIKGLIGEILFLRKFMFKKYGITNSLKAWSGSMGTHKDFSIDDTWYEVKVVSQSSLTVSISSLEQLDSSVEGELALFTIEKMSESYSGISLNNLIFDTLDLITQDEDKELFFHCVTSANYKYNVKYDQHVFELKGYNRYHVKEGFPRLTKEMISSSIVKIKYEILIHDLSSFQVRGDDIE